MSPERSAPVHSPLPRGDGPYTVSPLLGRSPKALTVVQGFFVTGTDTDVGKTVVAAWLVARLGAAYWKPVQAGTDPETDSDTVRRLAGVGRGRMLPGAYVVQA